MEITQAFLKQLSLKTKAALVSGKDFWYTAEDQDHKISKVMMTDGPSGLRKQAETGDALGINNSVKAVSFPVSALTASSFNRRKINQLGVQLGKAAKAENVSILLGPGVNIKRSPLAGRNFEYFSEDPYLAGEMGTAYVKGVQSQGVGVSVKHFAANNRENQRFTSSSEMDERTLREIYLLAFEKIVKDADPATLMCSYNKINGTLNSQNKRLLTEILRDEWGFDGLVMSDWGAVADHIAAIKAGLDLEMPGKGEESVQEIIDAVNSGALDEYQLNNSVRRVLKMVNQWSNNGSAVRDYDKEEQHQFARQLAADGMVLLKNDHQILPLKPGDSLAVLGELAQKPRYQGGGSSHVNAFRVSIPFEEIQKRANAQYAAGYSLTRDQVDQKVLDQALNVAKNATKVVIFAGFPAADESEGYDKESISLPENQVALINAAGQLNKPVVVVLQNGSAVEMPWIAQADGILETYLAGEAVGEATCDVLFGDVNPSGKLAETFPLTLADNPTFGTFGTDRDVEKYHEGIFAGYRYYDVKNKPVRFPFGFGLSYTSFKYDQLSLTVHGDQVKVTFNVTNTGSRVGQTVAQIYVGNQTSHVETAVRELKNFTKISLKPAETKTVTSELSWRDFSWYNEQLHQWQVDAGNYEVSVGTSSRKIELSQIAKITPRGQQQLKVTDETYISDLDGHPELNDALVRSGLASAIQKVTEQSDSAKLLKNMPLRAGVMIGIKPQQVKQFIELANQ